jgi:chromosome segregation ATPase
MDTDALNAEIAALEGIAIPLISSLLLMNLQIEQIQKAKPNLGVLKEYRKQQAEYDKRAQALSEVKAQYDEAKKSFEELRSKRLDEFMTGFAAISLKLKEMYQVGTLAQDQ